MTAEIHQFIPKPNPNRALTSPIEIMVAEILKDEDRAPEYIAPDTDSA